MPRPLDHIDTIIFDFDGTIADTMSLGVAISNEISEKYRFKKIGSPEALNFYRNLPTRDALRAIGISLIKLPFVANAFRKRLAENIDSLKPVPHMPEVIRSLASQYRLGVVTSNSMENTVAFMKKYRMDDCISHYATGIRIFKKYATISKLVKKHRLSTDKILLVGDETRDVEAAKKAGLPVVSVLWGFHTRAVLQQYNPDYIIEHPDELMALLLC